MKDFYLITQDACPQCEVFKTMLAKPLKGEYDERIQVVHRQQDPDTFAQLTLENGISSTPAIIRMSDQKVLMFVKGVGELKNFLDGK